MRTHIVIVAAGLAIGLAACGDSSGPKAVPSSIAFTVAPASAAAAGSVLPVAPTFVVKDKDGNPIAGASVSLKVPGGGGTIANAPTKSTAPTTTVGTWTLGETVGINTLTITVGSLTPLVLNITSIAGAPAKLIAVPPTSLTGVVAQPVTAPISAVLKDANDNGIAGALVDVSVTGNGSSLEAALTTDATGNMTFPLTEWVLGTTKGNRTMTLPKGPASVTFTVAAAAGQIQSLNLLAGNNQSGPAGTALAQPVLLVGVDQYGNRLDNQVVNFSVLAGGGKLAAFTSTSAVDGAITM